MPQTPDSQGARPPQDPTRIGFRRPSPPPRASPPPQYAAARLRSQRSVGHGDIPRPRPPAGHSRGEPGHPGPTPCPRRHAPRDRHVPLSRQARAALRPRARTDRCAPSSPRDRQGPAVLPRGDPARAAQHEAHSDGPGGLRLRSGGPAAGMERAGRRHHPQRPPSGDGKHPLGLGGAARRVPAIRRCTTLSSSPGPSFTQLVAVHRPGARDQFLVGALRPLAFPNHLLDADDGPGAHGRCRRQRSRYGRPAESSTVFCPATNKRSGDSEFMP